MTVIVNVKFTFSPLSLPFCSLWWWLELPFDCYRWKHITG